MLTISDKKELRHQLSDWQANGERVALVPTMGSLHDGHLSLIRVARQHAARVVATIFVNPTQFGPGEDYAIYPRELHNDTKRLSAENVDVLFAPDISTVYPFGIENATRVLVPQLTEELCGEARPGHFDGVSSVVARLFALVQPDVAVFGQKDYQQQLVIRRMVDDLSLPIDIVAGPTVREPDGLAMSSRNAFLNPDQRSAATSIYRSLQEVEERLRSGERDFAMLERTTIERLGESVREVQYLAIRQAHDLAIPQPDCNHLVILTAAFVGDVRLIDNIVVDLA